MKIVLYDLLDSQMTAPIRLQFFLNILQEKTSSIHLQSIFFVIASRKFNYCRVTEREIMHNLC